MSEGSTSGSKVQCQHCSQNTHLADGCPFLHTNCTIAGCTGLRKLLVSKTEKNLGRKFLKCHLSSCNGFQWFDDAILETQGHEVPRQGCYTCGSSAHWMKDYNWDSVPCKVCNEKLSMKILTNPKSSGRRYLKCKSCRHFEWFTEEIPSTQMVHHEEKIPSPVLVKPAGAKIVSEATVDGLCVKFKTSITFE